jgi:uncharacterized protein (TIGR00730 family)
VVSSACPEHESSFDKLRTNGTIRSLNDMHSLCVFCGSSAGAQSAYADAARAMGRTLAERGVRLVYGGGHVGLMGVLADAAMAAGGDVIGVITEGLQLREVGHKGLPELRVVESMHERKAVMARLSEAFVALPGGAGTLDELFEAWTWTQLGIHRKPIGFLNTAGYFDPLLTFLDRAVAERFIRADDRASLIVDTDPGALLDRLATATLPAVDKWIERGGVRP